MFHLFQKYSHSWVQLKVSIVRVPPQATYQIQISSNLPSIKVTDFQNQFFRSLFKDLISNQVLYLFTWLYFFLGQFHFVAQELRLLLFPSIEVADLCYHACIIEPFYTKLYMYGQRSPFQTQDQAGSRLVEKYLTFMCAILASISSIRVEGSNFQCFLYRCLPPSFPLWRCIMDNWNSIQALWNDFSPFKK